MSRLLIAALALAACSKNNAEPNAPASTPSTVELDALWALAPADTELALVMSPRAITLLDHGWSDVRSLLAAAPELAPARDKVQGALRGLFGKPDVTLPELGLHAGGGAAIFVSKTAGTVVVLPVADRAKFLTAVGGQKGEGEDVIGELTCRSVDGAFVCATRAEGFAARGTGAAAARATLATLGGRGDIEGIAQVLDGARTVAAAGAIQLTRGAGVARLVVTGLPSEMRTFVFGKEATPRVAPNSTAGFAVYDLGVILKLVPELPLVAGVTAADLARSIDGPLTIHIANGVRTIDARISVRDPGPARMVFERCTAIPVLAQLGARIVNNACHIDVPGYGFGVDMWVEGSEIRLGSKAPALPPVPVAMTALGAELARRPVVLAVWGRGSVFGRDAAAVTASPIPPGMDPAQAPQLIRGLGIMNELGLAVYFDDDKLRVTFGVRTMWANPDDVVAKLIAIAPREVLEGTPGAAGRALAEAAPTSPFAADYHAGTTSLMVATAVIGVVAAIGVPAYLDYMNKGSRRRSEAENNLDQIARAAKAHYVLHGVFPTETSPLTPPQPSCQSPTGRSEPGASWRHAAWTALEFSISEPTLFRYRYQSDGKTFEATATGDLDCDGNEITYTLRVTAPNGVPASEIIPPSTPD